MRTKALQKKIGSIMRTRREALGYSQESFADEIGLHRNYYGSVERGERNVSLQNLEKIAVGLKVALSALIFDAERSST